MEGTHIYLHAVGDIIMIQWGFFKTLCNSVITVSKCMQVMDRVKTECLNVRCSNQMFFQYLFLGRRQGRKVPYRLIESELHSFMSRSSLNQRLFISYISYIYTHMHI